MKGAPKQKLVFFPRRVPKIDVDVMRLLYPEKVERPKKRADCINGIRPCPYVSCRHNLYLQVKEDTGAFKTTQDCEPWDMDPARSCVLDIAEDDRKTLEEVGGILNLTRERTRQIQEVARKKLRAALMEDPDFDEFKKR